MKKLWALPLVLMLVIGACTSSDDGSTASTGATGVPSGEVNLTM